MRAASAIAASRSSASNTSQPPSASLMATNGPSVVKRLVVLHTDGRGRLGGPELEARVTPGVSLIAL